MSKLIKSDNPNTLCANCKNFSIYQDDIPKYLAGKKVTYLCILGKWEGDEQYCNFNQLDCDSFYCIQKLF